MSRDRPSPDPFADLFATIESLVLCHSPSGVEGETNAALCDRFAALGVDVTGDDADNVIATLPGTSGDRAIAITGHKDEIGAVVKAIEPDGRAIVRKLGGAFPWVYGEGVMDLLGDRETISGVLSFGSRHISHESPQKSLQGDRPLRWEDAWVETKCSPDDLQRAGVRPGTRVVVGKHRKRPFRLNDYIASYTLDNKASVAILLALAERLRDTPLPVTVHLVASAKEEVGAIGALYFSNRHRLDALIALEICPLAAEYPVRDGDAPVLLAKDGYGIYDEGLLQQLTAAADRASVPVQIAALDGFGSDGSIAMKFGHVARAACLSFPTQNTHGYEIAHLGAIAHCTDILAAYCTTPEHFAR